MIDPEEFEFHIEHADDMIVRKIMIQTKTAHRLLGILRTSLATEPAEVIELIVLELRKPVEALGEMYAKPGLDMFTRKALGKLLEAMGAEMDYASDILAKRSEVQNEKISNIFKYESKQSPADRTAD